jgi:hypothetical protein
MPPRCPEHHQPSRNPRGQTMTWLFHQSLSGPEGVVSHLSRDQSGVPEAVRLGVRHPKLRRRSRSGLIRAPPGKARRNGRVSSK